MAVPILRPSSTSYPHPPATRFSSTQAHRAFWHAESAGECNEVTISTELTSFTLYRYYGLDGHVPPSRRLGVSFLPLNCHDRSFNNCYISIPSSTFNSPSPTIRFITPASLTSASLTSTIPSTKIAQPIIDDIPRPGTVKSIIPCTPLGIVKCYHEISQAAISIALPFLAIWTLYSVLSTFSSSSFDVTSTTQPNTSDLVKFNIFTAGYQGNRSLEASSMHTSSTSTVASTILPSSTTTTTTTTVIFDELDALVPRREACRIANPMPVERQPRPYPPTDSGPILLLPSPILLHLSSSMSGHLNKHRQLADLRSQSDSQASFLFTH
ncbi:hypothetical protein P692DRAFT_20879662 [Suillus brevipes Sb2]|nr:hypothetical protein P692DRAFT_20879662 [Suillus brevipes Sb2]